MRLMFSLLLSLLLSLSGSVQAWQLSLQNDEAGTAYIAVKNEKSLSQVQIYLAWFNLDDDVIQSWTVEDGWQAGLMPIASQIFAEMSPFAEENLTPLPALCDSEQRCFLALIAVPEGHGLADEADWAASTVLPLTVSAGRERLPSQQFFLPALNNSDTNRDFDAIAGEEAVAAAPEAEESTAADDATSGSTTETEKPDIFRLIDQKLYYANSQAEKLQVIDVSDPSAPSLVSETKLSGNPQELYALDGYVILVQNDYDNGSQTRLTVLQSLPDGSMQTVDEQVLEGSFIESRRRNQVIYTVLNKDQIYYYWDDVVLEEEAIDPVEVESSEPAIEPVVEEDCFDYCGTQQTMTVTAFTVGADGHLTKTDSADLSGYSPRLAIFNDYLVLASQNPNDWTSNWIQTFYLADASQPLQALSTIQVPGQIPSEFHLNVKDQQLRVVYGPADRSTGSSLAIFDLSNQEPSLIGQVGDIAAGEALFATRFVDDKAYVVTYERTDPLWVIDLSDPTKPSIIGELHVPGWSEKLFFNEDRLFAVGIHDQPTEAEGEISVSRVAVSLFDVSDPTNPSLINRVVPLEGEVQWSYSEALYDERALLLDWQQQYAALPLQSWQSSATQYLQVVSFDSGQLAEAGRVESPVYLRRSVELSDHILAGLGDQSLMTLQWGNGQAQVLGELELAVNVGWLQQQAGSLWAAGYGNDGYQHFYRYDANKPEKAQQRWALSRGYQSIAMGEGVAAFYNTNPLAVQTLDLASGELQTPVVLEALESTDDVVYEDYWYGWQQRSAGFIANGMFHIGELETIKFAGSTDSSTSCVKGEICILPALMPIPVPEEETNQYLTQWTLKSWPLNVAEPQAVTRSIAGEPIGFTAQGLLISKEMGAGNQLQLNVLSLSPSSANLVASQSIQCAYYSTEVLFQNDKLWVNCREEGTTLYQLDPAQQLAQVGMWQFDGYRSLTAVSDSGQRVMLNQGGYYYYYDYPEIAAVDVDIAATSILPPSSGYGCQVFELGADASSTLLAETDECYSASQVVLLDDKALKAKGFAGIETVSW